MFKAIFTVLPYVFMLAVMLAFVAPARMRVRFQAFWAIALLFCASKFTCFEAFGGNAFAPEMPEKLVWFWSWAYSGMCILFAATVAGRLLLRALRLSPSAPRVRTCWLFALPLLSWGISLAGTWSGFSAPGVTETVLEFDSLPDSLDGYRIVHVSDVHACSAATRWRTRRIVEAVNSADADLVCLTGDYFDGYSGDQARNLAPVAGLKARDGVLAVTGNHEYYYDTIGWFSTFHSWGIDFMENECAFPRPGLAVAGVSDPVCVRFGSLAPDPDAAFASATNGEFRILLQHRPKVNYEEFLGKTPESRCDLQISGHTHGGISPVIDQVVAAMNGGMVKGAYPRPGGGWTFVSPGVGQWAGFPIRLFNPSRIVVIVLRKAAPGGAAAPAEG